MSAAGASRNRLLALGSALALFVVALWIVLTAWSGKTYHLAPLLAAAAPGWTVRAVRAPMSPRLRVAVAVAGLAAVALGWAAILALAIEPTATIVHHQAGGVGGETAVGALIGALLGQVALLRSVRRGISAGRAHPKR